MAFLGIKISHDIARLLYNLDIPGNKEQTDQYHITILSFQENMPISEIAKALEATYDIVSNFKPFLVKTDTISCFPKRENNSCPIIAKIKSKEIHELNKQLKKKFDDLNIKYLKTFKDYKPHITLSYADKEIKEFKIDPLEFSIQEIVLWGGDHGDDRIFITFPLKSPEKYKNALLMKKVDLFYKFSLTSNS